MHWSLSALEHWNQISSQIALRNPELSSEHADVSIHEDQNVNKYSLENNFAYQWLTISSYHLPKIRVNVWIWSTSLKVTTSNQYRHHLRDLLHHQTVIGHPEIAPEKTNQKHLPAPCPEEQNCSQPFSTKAQQSQRNEERYVDWLPQDLQFWNSVA
nr:hypothetical protein Iba_scaffold1866CG0410 [Ipomoea batatas]